MVKVNDHVTLKDVIIHYNISVMAISFAVGMAGQQLLFSLADDVIIPTLSLLYRKLTGKQVDFLGNKTKFEIDKFVSVLLTFILVIITVMIVLSTVLLPIVKRQILVKREEEIKNEESKSHMLHLINQQKKTSDKLENIKKVVEKPHIQGV